MIPRIRLSKICWLDIPFKSRIMIIDRMDSKTRCLFSRCSKLCYDEARKSKFYVYGMEMCDGDNNGTPNLKIIFDEFGNGFWFDFLNAHKSETIVTYRCVKNGRKSAMWTISESADCKEVLLRYTIIYLEKYQKQLQSFKFCSADKDMEVPLRNLENLKKLEITNAPEEWTGLHNISLLKRQQLLRIDTIKLSTISISSDDLFEFKGQNAHVIIGDFDGCSFKKYLKMLKDGEISINSINICACLLKYEDFQNIGIDISFYTENKDGMIFSFLFDSEDMKYSVLYGARKLIIERKMVMKKLNQFIYWRKLPLHIQENVIDKMDVKSRCRFAQCSKDCETEASKRLKNDLYGIGVVKNEYLELQFSFSADSETDFWIEFMDQYENDNRSIIVYKTNDEIVKWTKIEEGKSKDVRLKYLEDYLAKYGRDNKIKCFRFDDDCLLSDFNINRFENLEKIEIDDNNLDSSDYVENGILKWETIRSCKHLSLYIYANLSFQQFLELDLETGNIQCDELAEGENFKNYMNMLKNGIIHTHLKSLQFCLSHIKTFSFKDFDPISKTGDRFSKRKYKYRSKNGIIRITRKEMDNEDHISIKCYEESE